MGMFSSITDKRLSTKGGIFRNRRSYFSFCCYFEPEWDDVDVGSSVVPDITPVCGFTQLVHLMGKFERRNASFLEIEEQE